MVSHLSDSLAVGGGVGLYENKKDFYLKLNYDQAGDFKQINIKAENKYYKATHTQKVKFDTNPVPPPPPTPDDDGLKWYVVVVVALVVLLIVGLAYGMFRYIKKKRSDKNVSLLTEKEEEGDTEEVPSRGSINNPLDEELHKDEDWTWLSA